MRSHFLSNLSLSVATVFFLAVTGFAGEHPSEHPSAPAEKSEHPSEHPEKKAKEAAEKAEHPEETVKKAAAKAEHPEHPEKHAKEAAGKAEHLEKHAKEAAAKGEHPEHPKKHAKEAAGKAEHPEHPEKHGEEATAEAEHTEHPEHPAENQKPVTKADIAKGIKAHIKSAAKEGGGRYKLGHKGTELSLKLKKVHKDKLAQLDNGQFFACTDLKGNDGNTYDVDFFLGGSAGEMDVTEAAVHKINGSPLYTWHQKPDGKWAKIPAAK